MSFILEALQKSESERQHNGEPGLNHLPRTSTKAHLPTWAACCIVLLGCGVIALTIAWWYTSRVQSVPQIGKPLGVTVGNRDIAGVNRPPPLAAVTIKPAMSKTNTQVEQTGGPSPRTPLQTTSAGPVAVGPASARATARDQSDHSAKARLDAQGTQRQDKPHVAAFLPKYAELAAREPSMPVLTLQLHAYSADPAQRFVFINGKKYKEGDTLDAGPRLIKITSGGAVLILDGQQFLLPRR